MFGTNFHAAVAAGASVGVDDEICADGVDRTAAQTKFALDALALVKRDIDQSVALEGAALVIFDVFQIFVTVVAQCREDGIGSCLTESAE